MFGILRNTLLSVFMTPLTPLFRMTASWHERGNKLASDNLGGVNNSYHYPISIEDITPYVSQEP